MTANIRTTLSILLDLLVIGLVSGLFAFVGEYFANRQLGQSLWNASLAGFIGAFLVGIALLLFGEAVE